MHLLSQLSHSPAASGRLLAIEKREPSRRQATGFYKLSKASLHHEVARCPKDLGQTNMPDL